MYKAIITVVMMVFGVGAAHSETYTMDTYYPSPVGVYTNVTVTSSTVLARDGGNVAIGTPLRPSKLDVNGPVAVSGVVVPGRFASDPTDSAQSIEGAIYYNTTLKRHRVFQNGAWADLGGSSSTGGFAFRTFRSTGVDLYGVGKYDSAAGKFYGNVMCDPVSYSGCGSGGYFWCGSGYMCVEGFAGSHGGSNTSGVSALPVINVIQRW